jgi:hypothetical protein
MRRRHYTRMTCALPLLAALLLATSCAPGSGVAEPVPELTSDDAFEDALVTVWRDGGSRKVVELTGFGWDGLRIFAEGTPAEEINGYVGGEAVRGRRYVSSRSLFVFTEAAKPVRLIMVSSDFLATDSYGRVFGPDVRLTVDQPGAGVGRLEG